MKMIFTAAPCLTVSAGTTENLMMAMAATLKQAVPQLIDLSPTSTEALAEIEATIQTIGGIAGAILVRSCGCAR
jgi:hypothetical protein